MDEGWVPCISNRYDCCNEGALSKPGVCKWIGGGNSLCNWNVNEQRFNAKIMKKIWSDFLLNRLSMMCG